jgi:hypothetical protein
MDSWQAQYQDFFHGLDGQATVGVWNNTVCVTVKAAFVPAGCLC